VVSGLSTFRLNRLVVHVVVGDITEFRGDAIVNPANTLGLMGGGVALAIKRRGGSVIEEEAVRQAPIPIGSAVVTTAGKLSAKAVIHAPTVERPGGSSSQDYVYKATKAALAKAVERGFKTIAFPLMGAGVGGLTPRESVEAMARGFREYSEHDLEIHIYVRSSDLVDEVVKTLIEEGFQQEEYSEQLSRSK